MDILIAFRSDADWGPLDHVRMQQELENLLERKVDLVSKRAVERSQNLLRRKEIPDTAKPLFSGPDVVHAAG